MPPKPRQMKVQQVSQLAAMQDLQDKSDEELEREQRNKAAAYALLGARAAERYDAKTARMWFQKAVAAARPQERMALRRMADASLAMAERRADDLKVAMERLGQEGPSNRQLMLLRLTALLLPPQGASTAKRVRGILLLLLLVVGLLAIGTGIAQLLGLAFGGIGLWASVWLGLLIVIVAFVVLYVLGRRKQRAARAARAG
ncbi:MAG TPA: hypothetical protein VD931_21725 [Baekduia sp.]|nr:hypothetical protein [Baekduia sp.]